MSKSLAVKQIPKGIITIFFTEVLNSSSDNFTVLQFTDSRDKENSNIILFLKNVFFLYYLRIMAGISLFIIHII